MQKILAKSLIFLIAVILNNAVSAQQLVTSAPILGQIPGNGRPNYSTLGTAPTSLATAFAVQAGEIAGVAQGCGQDITVFVDRVNEAIDRLSLSSTDKVIALARLQKTIHDVENAQATKQLIPCAQALQDYNSLPIMRPDYRQTVISQLSPTMGNSPIPPTTIPQGNPPGNIPTGPSPGATVGNLPPNINTLAPAGNPPPSDFPNAATANQAPNIIYQAPSVGPYVDTRVPAPNINDIAPNPYQDLNPPAAVTNPYVAPYPTRTDTPPSVNP